MKKLIVLLFALLLIISGCGNNKESAYAPSEASEDSGYIGNSYEYEEEKSEYDEANSIDNSIDPAATSDKLVYKGRIYLETLEYKEALVAVKDLVKKYEGIIEYESEYTSGARWYDDDSNTIMHSELRLRIPTKSFDAFLEAMEGKGQITSKDTEVINITKQYNDNSAHIEALESQQKRLLEMMEKAETIEDMIAVETRLTEVQSELNISKSYQATMNTDIKYSTINMHIDEVRKYSETRTSYGTRFVEAIKDSWYSFVETMGDIIIFLVHALPYLLILALLIFIFKKLNIHLPKREKKERKILFKKKEDNEIKE